MCVCVCVCLFKKRLISVIFFLSFRDALVIHGESLGLYDIAEPRFSSEFVQLLNSPELSDFSIIALDGQEIYVHQVILLTRWPHFKNIHKSGMSESIQRRMTIPEPFEVIMAFLKFLYSDRLDENEPWEVVCELLVMANMYLLHRLKKLCCERLFRCHLTIESCGLIFEKAIMAEEVGLKLLALSFMFQNYGSLLKSNMLMELPQSIRDEFLDSVPEEAVLEVGRTRHLNHYQQQQQNTTLYNSNSNNMIYVSNNNSSQPNISASNTNYHHHHHHHRQQQILNYTVASDVLLNQRTTPTTNELILINATNTTTTTNTATTNNNNNTSSDMSVEV